MMDVQRARLLRFGDFELDVRAAELRKHGLRLRLQGQSFQILLILLERPGEVVLREEIRQKLWPNNTIVEFDNSINAAIKRLRNALGESAEKPRYIETLAKRGYRFAGAVTRETKDLAKAPDPPPTVDADHLNGTTFSNFRVLEKLGSGGMGVVYRAEDLKLARQVALKFLQFPSDELCSSILDRFEREARTASALNHPHICTVHAVDNFAGKPVIVMELVEGETLEAKLARGPLTQKQAVVIAIQIAGALAAAHRKGIVHRDLKPANVMLTKSCVKVMDFGLAKMERPVVDGDQSIHEPGRIIGTLRYMSPEQAQGKETDPRTDIFSFGVMLYEMLSGKRPFPSGDFEPEPPSLDLPALDHLVRRCLKKDPDERWQSARDLQAELEWLAEPAPATAPRRWRDRWAWTAAAVVLGAIFGWLRLGSGGQERASMTLTIVPPSGIMLTEVGNGTSAPQISPDGSAVMYVADERHYIRRLDSPEPQLIPGGDGPGNDPFWSPDSTTVVMHTASSLRLLKVRLPDGPPQSIAPLPIYSRGGSWSDAGTILISAAPGVLRTVPASGGEFKPVEVPETLKTGRCLYPEFLSGSEDFLLEFVPDGEPDETAIYLATLRDGKAVNPVLLLKNQTAAGYTPAGSGRILFVRNDNLYSQRLNHKARKLEGEAELVAKGVASQPSSDTNRGDFSVARNGTVAWRPGKAALSQVTVFDRQGKSIGTSGPFGSYWGIVLSPDEKQLLVRSDAARLVDVGQPGYLELPKDVGWFGWSEGGARLIGAGRGAFWEMPGSGAGEVHELRRPGLRNRNGLPDISLDGKRVIATNSREIFSVPLFGTPEPAKTNIAEEKGVLNFGPRFSPDGRWFVYLRRDPQEGLYVQPFPGPGPRRQIAPSGEKAVWRKDGKEILYVDKLTVMSVTVETAGAELRFGAPRPLFSGLRRAPGTSQASTPLAVSRDGSRIFWLQGVEQPDSNMIYIKTGALK
jgi:eukaryotic-like serine/threonine-protein kinase